MDGVSIFLAVFACTPDALYCDDLSKGHAYRDMGECHLARDALAGAPGPAHAPLVFARCRYVLRAEAQDFRRPPAAFAEARGRLARH